MKKIFFFVTLFIAVILISSCEKDAGKLPLISFKTATGYTAADASITKGASIKMGVDCEKAEKYDVLKKFNISKSVNGAAAVSVYDQDLSGADQDKFSYDYSITQDTVVGRKTTYTYTITNRDGLVNQVTCTLTTK
ncbi:MAG: hypothetical protein ORN56_00490 [Chitinophagales bacterium]|nr:hypothetical protein [Chitinophagales bacterium]